jgi:hypothetical protein
MTERWAAIPGFGNRYEVSDAGRVRAVPARKRYLLRNGKPALRLTPEKVLAQQPINSGYSIVHLHHDGERRALLVHRLVATAFCGWAAGLDVNHRNGRKQDNRAANLEWVTRTGNHLHAVRLGLNRAAKPVIDPATGHRYPSIAQAARACRVAHRTVAAKFLRAEPVCV